jgi:translation initiation factor IF-1
MVAGAGTDTVVVVASATEPKPVPGRGAIAPRLFLSDAFLRRVCGVFGTLGSGHHQTHSMKEAPVEIEGVIHTVLPGTMFRVELDNKHLVLATISGRMRKRWVRLTVGDRVKMEMSPYDLDKARIVWRLQ